MSQLTIFTPAYNRKHTINRTYESLLRQTCKDFNWLIIDDGSSDGTRQWVETLGEKTDKKGIAYDWMGCSLDEKTEDHFVLVSHGLRIEYIFKPNGGLYTGYNVAYDTIQTELCVCIDSDDFAPSDLVQKIYERWNGRDKSKNYCGIVGLDYDVKTNKPIGGLAADGITSGYYYDVKLGGDTKEVLLTALMKFVAPMIGFEGEKDFNPIYMLSQVLDKYPILVDNSNYCWVEYQIGGDSMSQAIYKQYRRSPKSYVKFRLNDMKLSMNQTIKGKIRVCSHYVSACIFAHDKNWYEKSSLKLYTLISFPFGVFLNLYIRYKTRK